MDAGSSTNSKRIIDDLMAVTGSKDPKKFLKPFIKQRIEDQRRFIETQTPELELARSQVSRMKDLFAEMRPFSHVQGYFDFLMMLQNDHREALLKVNDLKCWIMNAEADIAEKTKLLED